MSGYGEFGCWVTAFALSAVRIGAALLVCPAFGEGMISGLARRLVILSFAFLVVPVVQRMMPAAGVSWALLALLAVKEALVGFLIGFFSAIPFWVAENVGNLIDFRAATDELRAADRPAAPPAGDELAERQRKFGVFMKDYRL